MRIDHLVWYCADLAHGQRYFDERMNCGSAYGGVHPGEGTANRLISLSETTYLEILGRDETQPENCLGAEIRTLAGHGLYHWAMGGVEIADLRARAEAVGLTGSDLVAGGRTLPSGNWLGWTCFGIHNHEFGALVPFFIDWVDSEHPAKSAPRGGVVNAIKAYSPHADKLRGLYRILGIGIPVFDADVPGLSVTLASRKGSFDLRMFDPVPRGYVI